MSVNERRDEIIRIMRGKVKTTVSYLANELGVSVSTIKRDILALTAEEHYPIDATKGNGGGIVLKNHRHPHKRILSQEHIAVLTELAQTENTYHAEVLNEILRAFA